MQWKPYCWIQHSFEPESLTVEWGLKTELVLPHQKSHNTMISTIELCFLQMYPYFSLWMLWNSGLKFHYQLSNLFFPALKWHSKWIELVYNSFSCSFRWVSLDNCIPKSSMINMMMSWPSLVLFWPREYWMQVNVFKSSRFIYLFTLSLIK